jgi:hypothetical protein
VVDGATTNSPIGQLPDCQGIFSFLQAFETKQREWTIIGLSTINDEGGNTCNVCSTSEIPSNFQQKLFVWKLQLPVSTDNDFKSGELMDASIKSNYKEGDISKLPKLGRLSQCIPIESSRQISCIAGNKMRSFLIQLNSNCNNSKVTLQLNIRNPN